MKRRWLTLAAMLASLHFTPCHSQTADNMVYNPSFEEHTTCPQRIDAMGVMREADAWWQPTGGSSDYFHACGGHECTVPRNKMGFQVARSGDAYCGIYCSQEHYREYLQTELKAPLIAGKRYKVSYWVSLADKSPHAVATLGALLTTERVEDSTRGILMDREVSELGSHESQSIAVYFEPQIINDADSVIANSREWTEVSGVFTAQGGERFLTLGNFRPFNKSTVMKTTNSNTPLQGAYYYVDDVSVVCLDSTTIPTPTPPPAPSEGKVTRLENVYFATGESSLLQQSYNELYRLKKMLEEHPDMCIELRGHTDNQGTVEYNQKLSEERAKAVADYLIRHGIEGRRLKWTGFGKSNPIADNDTPEGRQKNRRVEYIVLSR